MSKPCDKCKLRAIYERDQTALLGRLWRWHINFCPGWKSYYKSLDDKQQSVINEKYSYKK